MTMATSGKLIIPWGEIDMSASGALRWYEPIPKNHKEGWLQLFERCNTRYAPEDLHPSSQDPSIREGEAWPLGHYWPVYLSNFFIREWNEEAWYEEISDYFAHKGLLTRMMYFHTVDREYWEMQQESSLIEALVYFCSQADLLRAVASCHRDLYYGHRLIVLSAREPKYFDNNRSAWLKYHAPNSLYRPETLVENWFNHFGEVDIAKRITATEVVVQFKSKKDMLSALSSQYHWAPYVMEERFRIQRFTEKQVKQDIASVIASKEGFLEQKPRSTILNYFFDNLVPIVETTWKGHLEPKMPPIAEERRKKNWLKLKQKRLKLKQKRKIKAPKSIATDSIKEELVVAVEKEQDLEASCGDLDLEASCGDPDLEASCGDPDGRMKAAEFRRQRPRGQPFQEHRDEAIKAINYLLRLHGQPSIELGSIMLKRTKYYSSRRFPYPRSM